IEGFNASRSLLVFGIFVSMQVGSVVKDHTAVKRLATTMLLIPTLVLTILLVAWLSPHRVIVIVLFVAVSGLAIWLRRYRPRASALGAVGFFGYFFTLLIQPSGHGLLAFCAIATIAVATQTVVRTALLFTRP